MNRPFYKKLLCQLMIGSPISTYVAENDIKNAIDGFLAMTTRKADFKHLYCLLKDATMIFQPNVFSPKLKPEHFHHFSACQKNVARLLIDLLLSVRKTSTTVKFGIVKLQLLRQSNDSKFDEIVTLFKGILKGEHVYNAVESPANESPTFHLEPKSQDSADELRRSFELGKRALDALFPGHRSYSPLILVSNCNHQRGVYCPLSKTIVISNQEQEQGQRRITLFHEILHGLIANIRDQSSKNMIFNTTKRIINLSANELLGHDFYWANIIDTVQYPAHKIAEETMVRLIQENEWNHTIFTQKINELSGDLKDDILHLINCSNIICELINEGAKSEPTKEDMEWSDRQGRVCRAAIQGLTKPLRNSVCRETSTDMSLGALTPTLS